MTSYTFKTYLADGREYFVYGEKELTKKDFPFPESLLELLYLDVWSLEPLTKQMDRTLQELYQTREDRCAQEIQRLLDELAGKHIYFEFLRLDWMERLEQSRQNRYGDAVDVLPHKEIAWIPSNLDAMQKQILRLFAKALDIDGEKKSVQEKMVEYYTQAGDDTLNTFQFRPQPVNFEVIDSRTFTEVLYPNSIYDLIDFAVRECVKREVKLRVCKNCGRYFYFTGRISAEYCNRTVDDKGRTCKEIGAFRAWEKKRSGDDLFKLYRREYKKRFAWIKAGKISQEDFYAWSEQAREKKDACEAGICTRDEFEAWISSV